MAVLAVGAQGSYALGQGYVSREHQIKAAYLYNLGRYITWPESSFRSRQAPLVIGVVEPDHVGDDLRKIAEVKSIEGRPIHIQKYLRPEDVEHCHILFVPEGVDPEVQTELIRRLKGGHVLLVGESEEFLNRGGIIAFVVRDNNIRLIIAPEAAQGEGLQISSKLLQLALTTNR